MYKFIYSGSFLIYLLFHTLNNGNIYSYQSMKFDKVTRDCADNEDSQALLEKGFTFEERNGFIYPKTPFKLEAEKIRDQTEYIFIILKPLIVMLIAFGLLVGLFIKRHSSEFQDELESEDSEMIEKKLKR